MGSLGGWFAHLPFAHPLARSLTTETPNRGRKQTTIYFVINWLPPARGPLWDVPGSQKPWKTNFWGRSGAIWDPPPAAPEIQSGKLFTLLSFWAPWSMQRSEGVWRCADARRRRPAGALDRELVSRTLVVSFWLRRPMKAHSRTATLGHDLRGSCPLGPGGTLSCRSAQPLARSDRQGGV